VDPKDLIGHKLVDDTGGKIGTIDQVFLDDQTREPEWVSVNTGVFGGRDTFVPLTEARSSGEDFQVPYDKAMVKEAPALEVDSHLSVADEERLYQYYGVSGHGAAPDTAERETSAGTAAPETRPRPPSRPDIESDTELTRSEERLRFDTERFESGHVRLHKYVVTETVRENVPVSHEEVAIEREPITAENRGAITDTTMGEAERDIVLHAERAVPHKETVPVERVRMRVRSVDEEVPVSEELRRERIDVEDQREGRQKGQGRR
jgi:uncharacterized protein (TIGR02271 family)